MVGHLLGGRADHVDAPLDLAQRVIEQVASAPALARMERAAQVDRDSWQIVGQAGRRARIVALEIDSACSRPPYGGSDRLIERGPVGTRPLAVGAAQHDERS